MCIEGRNKRTEIPLEDMEHLFSHATIKIESQVEHVAYDNHGRKIDNLDAFILTQIQVCNIYTYRRLFQTAQIIVTLSQFQKQQK